MLENSSSTPPLTDVARRRFVALGLQAILAASVGPATTRASSLMPSRILRTAPALDPPFILSAVRPKMLADDGLWPRMWKESLVRKAKALTPENAAVGAVLDLVRHGAAQLEYESHPFCLCP